MPPKMTTAEQKALQFVSCGPWDNDEDRASHRFVSIEQIPQIDLAKELDLLHPVFSEEDLQSIAKSEWFRIDEGKYYIEVRNPQFANKLRGGAFIIDFDDCVFKTTQWHKNEYERIAASEELKKRGVSISVDEARELYQHSKIKIPGKSEREPRYTPLLNIILLSHFAKQLEDGMDRELAWNEMIRLKDEIADTVTRTDEHCLHDYSLDPDIIDVFTNNHPYSFLYADLVDLIFNNPIISHDLKVIATRGKIEGPLGQVYKLHASGIMEQDVDIVLYTNDQKARAIILLSRLFPQLQEMHIRAIDDNPDEILPYRELARSRGIGNLKLIHIRHPDAKRKDAIVDENEQPNFRYQDPLTGVIFDHYLPLPRLYAVF